MSRIYIVFLAIAALMISLIGAAFSIIGLTSLFAGAVISVGLMAGSLEFAKLVSAGFVYRYWGHINPIMRTYLATAIVVLSIITSLGIFGFLSAAYQKSTLHLKNEQLEIEALRRQDDHVKEEISRTERFIDEVPRSRISKKIALYTESRNQVQALHEQSQSINKKIEDMQYKILSTQTDVGPIIYVAETFHTDVDKVAKILIFVFVSVFDPLAICLVFAFSLAVRLKEKYRGNEYRIAGQTLSRPVDHRFKKKSA